MSHSERRISDPTSAQIARWRAERLTKESVGQTSSTAASPAAAIAVSQPLSKAHRAELEADLALLIRANQKKAEADRRALLTRISVEKKAPAIAPPPPDEGTAASWAVVIEDLNRGAKLRNPRFVIPGE